MSWYPGHMARAVRFLKTRLRLVDVVIEVADARAPLSSRNPDLMELVGGRPRLLVLTHRDLADPELTGEWITCLRDRGEEAVAVDARMGQGVDEVREWVSSSRNRIRRSWERPLRLVVVGVSNVGKSSLLNRLTGQRVARTGALPGVTRGEQWLRVANGPGGGIEALDMPGLLPPRPEAWVATRLVALGVLPWGRVPYPEVVSHLLEALGDRCGTALLERYGVECGPVDDVLTGIARRRGFVRAGGALDLEQAARALVIDFQEGKLGRITLERIPPREKR